MCPGQKLKSALPMCTLYSIARPAVSPAAWLFSGGTGSGTRLGAALEPVLLELLSGSSASGSSVSGSDGDGADNPSGLAGGGIGSGSGGLAHDGAAAPDAPVAAAELQAWRAAADR